MSSTKTSTSSRRSVIERFQHVRGFTEGLCEPLEIEDFLIQTMPDASPVRWHLAHTAWFFETFILEPHLSGYKTPEPLYNFLFNSYYNAVGEQFPRPLRGTQSRPTVKQVFEYRNHVDEQMVRLMESVDEDTLDEIVPLITLGLNHEQQHQELMLTDLKHGFFQNPLYPSYSEKVLPKAARQTVKPISFIPFGAGEVEVGHLGSGFSYDNEGPNHKVLVQDFELADRLVTNGEFLKFIEAGGYQEAKYWLSDGWSTSRSESWTAPLYWKKQGANWCEFTLNGLINLDLATPVTHVSYYEADAFATWANARLPSEFEWEMAASRVPIEGNFVESRQLHPLPDSQALPPQTPRQMYGDVWEWTRSPYMAYPGYKPAAGAVGEYNGKFMSNQMVLRGGSCVSSQDHLRATYRNFFYPQSRWQFMGLRLARDL